MLDCKPNDIIICLKAISLCRYWKVLDIKKYYKLLLVLNSGDKNAIMYIIENLEIGLIKDIIILDLLMIFLGRFMEDENFTLTRACKILMG
jgi:hypothetical protein